VRPIDDHDAIGRILRSAITDRVDAAIATIDVSSCCGCCGIKYLKEIHGLSESNQPPRNTIVGRQRAFGGMQVFMRGKATGRSAGRVLDPDWARFTITERGSVYQFEHQIAIVSLNPAISFGEVGDSGSVIISFDNQIVGLFFGVGRNVMNTRTGGTHPFLGMANHIDDVLSELDISIPFSPATTPASGVLEVIEEGEVNALRAVPEPYRAMREEMLRQPGTALLYKLAEQHRDEIVSLVNHCRPVTVAWHRAQGPAWLATVMGRIRERNNDLPTSVKGCELVEGLKRIRTALSEHGSEDLRASLDEHGSSLIDAVERSHTLYQLMDNLDVAMRVAEGELA